MIQNEGMPTPNRKIVEQYAPQVAQEIIAPGVFKGKAKREIEKRTNPQDLNATDMGKPRGRKSKTPRTKRGNPEGVNMGYTKVLYII